MDELAAEELGPAVVEQDDRDVVVDREAAVLERHEVVRVGRPRPGLDGARLAAAPAPRARSASGRRDRRRAAARTARARCRGRPATSDGTRRGWRSGRRSGRRGASCGGLSHGGSARRVPPGTVTSSRRTPCNGSRRSRGSGERWIPTARSSPRSPTTSTDRSRRSCWPTRTGSTRSPCACSAIRATPRRPPRTPSSAPTGRWPATTRHGSASSGSGRGWRRSCSTCVARG